MCVNVWMLCVFVMYDLLSCGLGALVFVLWRLLCFLTVVAVSCCFISIRCLPVLQILIIVNHDDHARFGARFGLLVVSFQDSSKNLGWDGLDGFGFISNTTRGGHSGGGTS